MRSSSLGIALGFAAVVALAAAGCGDPVTDVRVDTLDPNLEGVKGSQYHWPGQSCLLCHSAYGGASPEMSIGGTIFAAPTTGDVLGRPVENVKVRIIDSFGEEKTYATNCTGNFWIPKDDWSPGFPLAVEIECPSPGGKRSMSSRIGRDGSCGRCHAGSPNQGSPGWVVCSNSDQGFPAPTKETCPGVP